MSIDDKLTLCSFIELLVLWCAYKVVFILWGLFLTNDMEIIFVLIAKWQGHFNIAICTNENLVTNKQFIVFLSFFSLHKCVFQIFRKIQHITV